MVQTLVRSYGLHLWYEQVMDRDSESGMSVDRDRIRENESGGERGTSGGAGAESHEEGADHWILRKGPLNLHLDMAEKQLTFEEDRARVLFLERQSKMLG